MLADIGILHLSFLASGLSDLVSLLFLAGIQLFHNATLVSAVQQSESAMFIHISPSSWTSLHPHTPVHLGH